MQKKKNKKTWYLWLVLDGILFLAILLLVILLVKEKKKDDPQKGDSSSVGAFEHLQEEEPKGASEEELSWKNSDSSKETESTKAPELTPSEAPSPTPTKEPSPTPSPTPTEEPTPTATPTPTPPQVSEVAPVIENDAYSSYSTKAEGWWFERKTDHSQSTCWGYDAKYKFEENDVFFVNKNVSDDDKVIYLTFDCGYENGYTNSILDTLKKHNAHAIFFVTQTYIRDAKDIVKRMKEEGHLVGNHTVTHPNLANCSTEKVVKELTDCANYMKEATGYSLDAFMRPPEGAYSEKSLHITKDMGYKSILWSIAYLDWDTSNQPGKDYVVDHFTKYHHNGAIPLIHVVSESNMQALDDVLTMLEKEGYRFGSVAELQ